MLLATAFFMGGMADCVFASRIVLNDGTVYEGEILGEDSKKSVILNTQEGIFNVKRDEIVSVDGRNYEAPFSAQEKIKQREAIIQGLGKDLLVHIGPGGLTKSEYQTYLARYAREHGLEALTEKEKKLVLDQAVHDELIFQEALDEGIYRQPEIRNSIIVEYRARWTLAAINPQEITEDEVTNYYQTHPGEFVEPLKLKLKVMRSAPGLIEFPSFEQIHEKARTRPENLEWQDLSWVRKGDSFGAPFLQEVYDSIFQLEKGDISDILKDQSKVRYIFWVLDQKEAERIPLSDARDKIIPLIIEGKQKNAEENLRAKLKNKWPGKDEEESFWQAALEEGAHRRFPVRQRIINAYLAEKKTKAEDILPALRQKYQIQFMIKETAA